MTPEIDAYVRQTSSRLMAPQASQNKEDGVAFMLRKSQRVINQLQTLLKVPAKEFVESLCVDMMTTGDLTKAEEYVAAIAPMQRLLDQYHNDILSAKGIGDEWRQVQSMVREVRQVVIWIDDLQLHAMVDKEELRGVYSEGRLMFQK